MADPRGAEDRVVNGAAAAGGEPALGQLDGAGTPESVWLPWLRANPLPPMRWPAAGTAVVVAPHPDDEVLGVGGIISDLVVDGWRVRVLAVTDGEASHPHSTRHTPTELAALRREETRRALQVLGVDRPEIDHLGLPDGGVGDHEALLRRLVAAHVDGGDIVFCPHPADGHPDHEATARATRAACRRSGNPCHTYPVWLWHHAVPDDATIDWATARGHALTDRARQRKAAAIDCFASQTRDLGPAPADAAVLPPRVLDRFRRSFEVVFT